MPHEALSPFHSHARHCRCGLGYSRPSARRRTALFRGSGDDVDHHTCHNHYRCPTASHQGLCDARWINDSHTPRTRSFPDTSNNHHQASTYPPDEPHAPCTSIVSYPRHDDYNNHEADSFVAHSSDIYDNHSSGALKANVTHSYDINLAYWHINSIACCTHSVSSSAVAKFAHIRRRRGLLRHRWSA